MRIDRITLNNFRNYEYQTVEFGPEINVITGGNAQGKTNLIEAVYYLTGARSFRAKSDNELICFGKTESSLKADLYSENRSKSVEIAFGIGQRKKITVNGVKLRTAAELSGNLTAVLFCPDDLSIIRSAAVYRRKLMDGCLCQLRPRYASALAEYRRLYEGKTRILRDKDPAMFPVMEDFSRRMCEVGAILLHYRARFSAMLAERAAEIHREFSGGTEELTVSYKTVSTVEDTSASIKDLYTLLEKHMNSHRDAELAAGRCLSGVHKDDLQIAINGADARSYSSQGQARTAAISLKMAEREIHCSDTGEYPVLLLDDVLSELDGSRQDFILNRIDSGQVLITCCEDKSIAEKTGGRVLSVEGGSVTE